MIFLLFCVGNSFVSLAGCMTAIALGTENMSNQNKLAAADAFQQLVRLLRSTKTSQRVLLMVIKVVGTLCVGGFDRTITHSEIMLVLK